MRNQENQQEKIWEIRHQKHKNQSQIHALCYLQNLGYDQVTYQAVKIFYENYFKDEYFIVLKDVCILANIKLRLVCQPFDYTLADLSILDLTYQQKLQIMYGVCCGLKYMHEHSLFHTEITPHSIALTKKSNGKYISKLHLFQKAGTLYVPTKNHKRTNFPHIQTPYASPQVRSSANGNQKSDVWSVGVLLYTLLFGSSKGIKITKKNVEIQFPQGLPSWLTQIFPKTIQFNPKDRCQIITVLDFLNFAKTCAEVGEKYMPILNKKNVQSLK